jgi:hypothetical protein
MSPFLEIVIALAAGAAVLIQTLGLYILTDLRQRVVRLEDRIFEEHGYSPRGD